MTDLNPNQAVGLATKAVRTVDFDQEFAYDGPLGAFYTPQSTRFIVWAPTAKSVTVEIYESNQPDSNLASAHVMRRGERGTWVIEILGDLHLTAYTYLLDHGSLGLKRSQDPYAIAAVVNGDRSVVVNPAATQVEGFDRMPSFGKATDAIIYELNVRDFSVAEDSGISAKGKFLGLAEAGTHTSNGQITGLDYLKSLGFTHLQLLPIYDYATVDETEAKPTAYNWGYDPKNYNVPEGSYATDPYNPLSRILELKQTIKTLHDNGLRVIMDVVYNHVYQFDLQAFQKIVPGYFFRYDQAGNLSNGTGVGNDTASERYMMRRYILDSILYWTREFKLDGFRFDLMGIHDVETMLAVRQALNEIDPSIIILGEGWNLGTMLPYEDKAAQHNAYRMPGVAHFNDSIRNALKGGNFNQQEGGYVNGRPDLEKLVAQNLLVGIPNSAYASPDQVVHYVEAHDDLTLYDKLCYTHPHDSEEVRVRRALMATSLVLLAQGIPFIHAGQEFLRTKRLIENTYNAPDEINQFDWNRVAEHQETVDYVRGLIKLRKSSPLFRQNSYDEILNSLAVYQLHDGVIAYQLEDENSAYFVMINANDWRMPITYLPHGLYRKVIVDYTAPLEEGQVFDLNGHYEMPSLSVTVLERVEKAE